MKTNRFLGRLALAIVAAQLLLMLVTWVVTAALPQLPVRSLLSAEALRWLFGQFTSNLLSPILVWLLLALMAAGTVRASGFGSAVVTLFSRRSLLFRQTLGLWLVAFELLAFVVVTLLLTCVPHAILLSVTGHLFPSSFSRGLLPMLAAMLIVMSLSYGVASGTLSTLGHVHAPRTQGLRRMAVYMPVYILLVQFYYSLAFVFFWE